jgi:acyl-CoA synthetase (AMP-forming)/AMP-acid ligase II
MKKTLLSWLDSYPKDLPLWLFHGREFRVADVQKTLREKNDLLNFVRGKNVAIAEMNPLKIVMLLTLFDGVANSIFLLPPDQEIAVQAAFLDQIGTVYVFSDNDRVDWSIFNKTSSKNSLVLSTDVKSLETRWVIPTSGTTGKPKLISHTLDSLTRRTNTKFNGKKYIWGSLYGPKSFAGLQVYFQSLMSGSKLLLLDNNKDIHASVVELVSAKCNALSATPTMWKKLAMTPGFEELKLTQITLGGEIADRSILALLRKTFPEAKITHIYASTEAGVGFSIKDGKEGFPISYLEGSLEDVELRVNEDNILLIRSNCQEQLLLSKNADSLVDNDGWINTGDVVKRVGDRLHFLGRASGAINIGGNKVIPEEIEKVIRQVDGVAFVVVKGRKNSITGQLVEATVLPNKNEDFVSLKDRITAHCRKSLKPYKVPAFIKRADDICVSSSGKIKRNIRV